MEVRQLVPARGARREVFVDAIAFGRLELADHVAAEQDGMPAAWCLVG